MAGCASGTATETTAAAETSTAAADTSELFSNRDLAQTAVSTDATQITLTSGSDVTISEEGVYVLSGTAQNTTIIVDAPQDAKVQLVLSGVSMTMTIFRRFT